ncbi:hypothetical protein V1277_002318 [Bradyrhizobium sp. AZCC 1588]
MRGFPPPLWGRVRESGGHTGTARVNPFPQPLPARGRGALPVCSPHGAIDTGEKSTNQLFGCTKPFTFWLIARGETSWAT